MNLYFQMTITKELKLYKKLLRAAVCFVLFLSVTEIVLTSHVGCGSHNKRDNIYSMSLLQTLKRRGREIYSNFIGGSRVG